MSEAAESVAELYRREVERMFGDHPLDARSFPLFMEIREHFAELGMWLAAELPPCPELWRAVQELHGAMLLCNAAVAANWRSATVAPPYTVWPKGMPPR